MSKQLETKGCGLNRFNLGKPLIEWLLLEYIKRNSAGHEAWEVQFSGFTSLGYMRKHRITGWWSLTKTNITLADANCLYFYYLFYTYILAFLYKEELFLFHSITWFYQYAIMSYFKSSVCENSLVIIPFDFKSMPKLRMRVSSCVSLNCSRLSINIYLFSERIRCSMLILYFSCAKHESCNRKQCLKVKFWLLIHSW